MPKATRTNDGAMPKKQVRKAKAEKGNGTPVTLPTMMSPERDQSSQGSPALEQKIRARAYEIYLQRGGMGGSPEQDWFQRRVRFTGRRLNSGLH